MQNSFFSNSLYTPEFFVNSTIPDMLDILESEYNKQENKEAFLDFLRDDFRKQVGYRIQQPFIPNKVPLNQLRADNLSLWARIKKLLPNEILSDYVINTEGKYYLRANSFRSKFNSISLEERDKYFKEFFNTYSIKDQLIIAKILQTHLLLDNSNYNAFLKECINDFINLHQQNSTIPIIQNRTDRMKDTKPEIFISYNHNDQVIALKIKSDLEKEGFKVIIDVEKMRSGEGIEQFIFSCIEKSNVTLSLVSSNSLLSAWVAMETIISKVDENLRSRYFIPCYIDTDFFKRDFVDTALDKIEAEILEIDNLMKSRIDKRRGMEDLDKERTRYKKLENNLPEIVGKLKNSLCRDLTEDNYEKNIKKIIDELKNKSALKQTSNLLKQYEEDNIGLISDEALILKNIIINGLISKIEGKYNETHCSEILFEVENITKNSIKDYTLEVKIYKDLIFPTSTQNLEYIRKEGYYFFTLRGKTIYAGGTAFLKLKVYSSITENIAKKPFDLLIVTKLSSDLGMQEKQIDLADFWEVEIDNTTMKLKEFITKYWS